MDGLVAPLDKICNLAEQYDALVMIDECHAAGFLGDTGRGTLEAKGVLNRIDIITGTLGKALGGGMGGYTTGKKEIISMGIDEIDPSTFTGEKITPKELHEKLNNNEDIILLDTRNEYEVRLGTFEDAVDLNLDSFRDFPNKIMSLDQKMKNKEIVMFCTGGVRCEKASALMLKNGFKNVKQIDGGVIKYFEETGGAYWNGDCFVFDDRVALDKNLNETDYILCFRCREPLNKKEIDSDKYKIDEYCPYCFDEVFS